MKLTDALEPRHADNCTMKAADGDVPRRVGRPARSSRFVGKQFWPFACSEPHTDKCPFSHNLFAHCTGVAVLPGQRRPQRVDLFADVSCGALYVLDTDVEDTKKELNGISHWLNVAQVQGRRSKAKRARGRPCAALYESRGKPALDIVVTKNASFSHTFCQRVRFKPGRHTGQSIPKRRRCGDVAYPPAAASAPRASPSTAEASAVRVGNPAAQSATSASPFASSNLRPEKQLCRVVGCTEESKRGYDNKASRAAQRIQCDHVCMTHWLRLHRAKQNKLGALWTDEQLRQDPRRRRDFV